MTTTTAATTQTLSLETILKVQMMQTNERPAVTKTTTTRTTRHRSSSRTLFRVWSAAIGAAACIALLVSTTTSNSSTSTGSLLLLEETQLTTPLRRGGNAPPRLLQREDGIQEDDPYKDMDVEELKFNAALFGGPGWYKRILLMLISTDIFVKEKSITWLLAHAQWIFRTYKVKPSTEPYTLPTAATQIALPTTFNNEIGGTSNTEEVLNFLNTGAFMVLQNGEIVYEQYFRTGGQSTQWMISSLSKSITSTALSLAIDDGLVGSLDDFVTQYIPELRGSAWDGSTIRHVLTMTGTAQEDFIKLSLFLITGSSLVNNLKKHKSRGVDAGTSYQYVNTNANVISVLVERVTGMRMSDYVGERLWKPMGFQDKAFLLKDNKGVSNGSGWVMTARDCAKWGEVMRNNGVNHKGEQLVNPAWIADATVEQTRSPNISVLRNFGYGYFWWVKSNTPTIQDYMGSGAFTNNMYINKGKNVTIVHFAATRILPSGANAAERTYELYRAISNLF